MDIQPITRTVTEFNLVLSEADAQQAMSSPYSFADELAERLRALMPGNGHAKGGGRKSNPKSQISLGKRGRKQGMKASGEGPLGLGPFKCSVVNCGETFLRAGNLRRHQVKVHGFEDPADGKTQKSAQDPAA